MHKQLRAAIAVEIVVLVIALGFSIAYFTLGLYDHARALDVLLVVLWVLVAAALLLVFRSRSLEREEMVRRFYLSEDWIYNHEIGYAPLEQIVPDRDPYEFVTYAAHALARMSYGFEVADPPSDFQPKWRIISYIFRYHLADEPELEEAEQGVVIDQWRGRLQSVTLREDGTHDYAVIGSFANATELARLLDGILVPDSKPLDDTGELYVLDQIAGGMIEGGYFK